MSRRLYLAWRLYSSLNYSWHLAWHKAAYQRDSNRIPLRGFPGTYSRMSAEVRWRRSITDSYGQIFTPFITMPGLEFPWRLSIVST